MAKKLSARALRQHLGAKSREELVDELVALAAKYDAVQEFYRVQLHGTYSQELLDRYKAIITKEFFRGLGPGPGRIAVARRAVMDYTKLAASPVSIAEIMVHYVESGVAYTRQFGDISAPFYASMEAMYLGTIRYLLAHNLEDQFRERCRTIMRNTSGIGWGFNDTMVEFFYTYLDDAGEDDEEADPQG